jgi:hypothetical protein
MASTSDEQRERVDGEARRRHDGEHADQAHGDRHQRDDRGAQRAQEQEHHQRHEADGLQGGLVDGLDGAVDEDRVVVGDDEGQPRRQVGLDPGHDLAHACGDVQRVGRGVADDAGGHCRQAVQAHDGALARGGLLDARHILQPHREAVDHLQRDLLELALGVQVGARGDVELALAALDAAGGHFQVLAAQRIFHVLGGEAVGGELVRIEPDAHGELAVAVDLHVGHAGDGLQARLDDAVDEVGDLRRRHRR